MENQSTQYPRFHHPYSLRTLSYFIIFLLFIQGPILIVAQPNQYESVIALNNNIRSSSTGSTVLNHDDVSYDAGSDIYDDSEDFEEVSSSSSTTTSISQVKLSPNITSYLPAQTEQVHKNEYEDESESYPNDENPDDETTNQDNSQIFGDTASNNRPDLNPSIPNSNNRKGSDFSTSRIPFVPSNLWRDLFSKPGILVGIIGGIVIGMLSAILLVMFIIYRMRKKDEGSYALEEGPRKSPSHAYTRVSSREFFA
jgi:hypothetical protein